MRRSVLMRIFLMPKHYRRHKPRYMKRQKNCVIESGYAAQGIPTFAHISRYEMCV